MADRKTGLLERLADSRAALLALVNEMNESAWETAVFPHDEHTAWTVADLLRHLVEAERSMIRLMVNIRDGGSGASPDFDLDRWNASRVAKTQHKSPSQLLEELSNYRQELQQFITALQEDDWAKKGRHGSGQMMTIGEICAVIADHEAQHTSDMLATLQ